VRPYQAAKCSRPKTVRGWPGSSVPPLGLWRVATPALTRPGTLRRAYDPKITQPLKIAWRLAGFLTRLPFGHGRPNVGFTEAPNQEQYVHSFSATLTRRVELQPDDCFVSVAKNDWPNGEESNPPLPLYIGCSAI